MVMLLGFDQPLDHLTLVVPVECTLSIYPFSSRFGLLLLEEWFSPGDALDLPACDMVDVPLRIDVVLFPFA